MIATPTLWLPPEKPAIVRANDLPGVPSWRSAASFGAIFPFPFFVNKSGTWRTSASAALDANTTGWGGYTLRQVINSAQLSNGGGSLIRVTFTASSANDYVVANAYVQHAAAAGDAYDFASTPVQLLFSGSAGVTITANTSKVSDAASFVLDTSKNLVISIYASAASATRSKATLTGWQAYYLSGSDAATVNTSGYANTSNVAHLVSLVETFG